MLSTVGGRACVVVEMGVPNDGSDTVRCGIFPRTGSWLDRMTDDRWSDLAATLESRAATMPLVDAVCSVAAERFSTRWVGMTLCIGTSFTRLAAEGAVAGYLDDRQFALGEGPSWDCAATALPTLATDLLSAGAGFVERWPSFCREAVDHGVGAAFAFPLQVGLVTVAVLTSYRDHPGPLSAAQYVDALTLASLATTALMADQSGERSGELAEVFRAGVHERSRLHRAAGMVAERESISIVEAMVRVRGHAYATGRPLGDVARDICDRRLVLPFEEDQ